MLSARLRRQDGFIREIFWLAVAIAVVAVVLLDALALFNAHQTVHDNARAAAVAARQQYAQTSDVTQAKAEARDSLTRSADKLLAFSADRGPEGDPVFTVKAQGHADTFAFHYLRYVGLKKWVKTMTDPIASESSN